MLFPRMKNAMACYLIIEYFIPGFYLLFYNLCHIDINKRIKLSAIFLQTILSFSLQ